MARKVVTTTENFEWDEKEKNWKPTHKTVETSVDSGEDLPHLPERTEYHPWWERPHPYFF